MTTTIADGVPNDWRQPFIDYFQHGRLPDDLKKRAEIGHRAPHFLYCRDTLFRISFGEMLLRCLSNTEGAQVVVEAHAGIYGHINQGLSSTFKSNVWGITSQRWQRIAYIMHRHVNHVKTTPSSSINP
ncbi:hypothetical protein LIER_15450 [Lithospermum erythrorhizon]|uniref:Uncharacterized protein n=1 Tax=Lithospermum erythrorhizon TaxID=34254 RepID=A0AAV3Q5J0_LITER